jgi:hypothetical protein
MFYFSTFDVSNYQIKNWLGQFSGELIAKPVSPAYGLNITHYYAEFRAVWAVADSNPADICA